MIKEIQEHSTFADWLRESVMAKLIFIALLVLLLLIPSASINDLINERAARQIQTMKEVSDQWSASQLIQGPVLVIPYTRQSVEKGDKGKDVIKQVNENLFILPDTLNIQSGLQSRVLYRGIFEAVVYNTHLKMSGNFAKAELDKFSIRPDQLLLSKAKLVFGVGDLKGLTSNPSAKINNQAVNAEPETDQDAPLKNALKLNAAIVANAALPLTFSIDMDLKGSDALSFKQLGKTTHVTMSGDWTSPSFFGRYLPDSRKVDEKGFTASWNMVYYNRPYPQQWVENSSLLYNSQKNDEANFGVRLRLPVDQYQKTMRTSKYSLLVIILTFVSLFLTELIRKQKIHILNYMLIGAAMVIYYTLLLSFAEQIGYNLAYLVASAATISLIGIFIASLLKNSRAAMLFALILSVFYGFIYVLIQLEDLSLLFGSVALFIVVAVLMYFSRKISWEKRESY